MRDSFTVVGTYYLNPARSPSFRFATNFITDGSALPWQPLGTSPSDRPAATAVR